MTRLRLTGAGCVKCGCLIADQGRWARYCTTCRHEPAEQALRPPMDTLS